MANSDQIETEEDASSTPLKSSIDGYGVTINLGVPVLKISVLLEAPPPRRRTLREAWLDLWVTDPPVFPVRLGPGAPWPKSRRILPAFLTSTLLHSSLVFFLYSIPFAALLALYMGPPPERMLSHPHMVVYKFRPLNLADYLPVIRPPGHGKAPGRGAHHGARPRLGSTHFDPRITIVSNPPHPDNFRVTLRNQNAPPALQAPAGFKSPGFHCRRPGARLPRLLSLRRRLPKKLIPPRRKNRMWLHLPTPWIPSPWCRS